VPTGQKVLVQVLVVVVVVQVLVPRKLHLHQWRRLAHLCY
jgi:hypothetical protein